MLLVFGSHFFTVYFSQHGVLWVAWIQRLFMIASPTFITVSGLMLGFLYKNRLLAFDSIRLKLIDRAAFLLTIGHVLIMLAQAALPGGFDSAIRWVYITDAIGFSIIAGSLLITRTNIRTRLLIGVLLLWVSWITTLFFHPSSAILHGIHDTLFGTLSDEKPYLVGFSLVPWFSFYLMGSCLGEVLGDNLNHPKRMASLVLGVAVCSVGPAIVIKGTYMFLYHYGIIVHHEWVYKLTNLFQKYPPGPIYFLFYGGIGMFMLFLLLRYREARIVKFYVSWISVLGRASLVTFIIQYYVYWVFMPNICIPAIFWMLPLIGSVAFIYMLSYLWLRKGLNVLLTVGLYKGHAHVDGHKFLR